MSVLYEVIFRRKQLQTPTKKGIFVLLSFVLLLIILTSSSFSLFGFTTFWSAMIALGVSIVVLYFARPSSARDGVVTGVGMVIIATLFFYLPVLFIAPQWVEVTYQFETLSNIRLLGIPVEEHIFWLLAGLFWGPLYQVAQLTR